MQELRSYCKMELAMDFEMARKDKAEEAVMDTLSHKVQGFL